MGVLTWIFRVVILVLLIFLAVQNVTPTRFTLFNDISIELPLIVFLFGFFELGTLLGLLILLPKYWGLSWTLRKLRKENETQKAQLAQAGVAPAEPVYDVPMTM